MILRAREMLLGVSRWYVVIAMLAIIFALSSLPNVAEPRQAAFPFDKVAHFGEYAVLGFALAGALRRDAPRRWPAAALIVASVAAAALYGASDEYHQRFVAGRDAAFSDWLADVSGATAGALASAVLVRRRELGRERE